MRRTEIYTGKHGGAEMPPELQCYRADAKFDWADTRTVMPMGYTEGQIAFSDGFIEGYWKAREYHSIKNVLKRLFKLK